MALEWFAGVVYAARAAKIEQLIEHGEVGYKRRFVDNKGHEGLQAKIGQCKQKLPSLR